MRSGGEGERGACLPNVQVFLDRLWWRSVWPGRVLEWRGPDDHDRHWRQGEKSASLRLRLSIVDLLPLGTWSPAARDADDAVADLEQRVGHRLPADLRELHQRCRDVSLFDGRYEFLAPAAMESIGQLQCGDDTDDWAPRTWLAVIDMHDGNYIAVDLVPNADGSNSWLDCDHEVIGEARVVAVSLEELIVRALACAERPYWLERGYQPYRTLTYENPPSHWRRVDGRWYASLGDEVGPERCAQAGCERRHIVHSVMCRVHHYEMVKRRGCPFEGSER